MVILHKICSRIFAASEINNAPSEKWIKYLDGSTGKNKNSAFN
jgi:hypothetical protein